MTEPPLSGELGGYPSAPGWKTEGTSRDAAHAIEPHARTLRDRVLALLRIDRLTADEVADRLGETVLSVRPRLSELSRQALIVKTGERRPNASGMNAWVWMAARDCSPAEYARETGWGA